MILRNAFARLNATFPSACRIVGDKPPEDQKQYTIVILGVPRGGTTMVAGVAQRCGLPIGENLLENLEDPDFHNQPVPDMRLTIEKRNAAFDVWGWKYPRAADYLVALLPQLRNPRLVVVFRDVVANMARILKPDESEMKALRTVFNMQRKNIELIEAAQLPTLLVSYEKAIHNPLNFAGDLASFMRLPPPSDDDELRNFTKPGFYKPVKPLIAS